MITWGNLKQQIRDLGFEEDSTMREYNTVVINASNRAIDMIVNDIIVPNKEYFGGLYATKKKVVDEVTGETKYKVIKWEQPELDPITENTPDDFEIDLPDRVDYIVPLLASHYVWLDDDQVKATIYWNEYDDFRTRLYEEARSRNYNCEFYGGLWF